jgi:hypothetical protein
VDEDIGLQAYSYIGHGWSVSGRLVEGLPRLCVADRPSMMNDLAGGRSTSRRRGRSRAVRAVRAVWIHS